MNLREAFAASEPLPTLHYLIELVCRLIGVLLKSASSDIRTDNRAIWYSRQTDSLWRPLNRRRFRIARPSEVLERLLKPCTRILRRFLGW